jgi:hypothetical protein
VVLALILLTLGFQLAAPEAEGARFITVCLQAATLVAAVVAARAHRWVVRVAIAASIVLVAGAAGALVNTEDLGEDSSRLISALLIALAPPAIVVGMIKHQREEPGVTRYTMFGVLCIYLLIGLLFASVFAVESALANESFFTTTAGDTSDFLYYSFATLTTTGYGDLIAATNLGRSLSIIEALIGQIYLVTVVAVIVSNLRPPVAGRRGA